MLFPNNSIYLQDKFCFSSPMAVESFVLEVYEILEEKKIHSKVFHIRSGEEGILLVWGDVSRSYHATEKLRVIF